MIDTKTPPDLVGELEALVCQREERGRLARARDAVRARFGDAGPDPAKAAAAELLSLKPAAIASVVHSPAGPVITTAGDGVEYVAVPDDRPDAEGKTGVMLRRPGSRLSTFPVYAGPVTPAPTAERAAAPTERRAPTIDPPQILADMAARPAGPDGTDRPETLTTVSQIERLLRSIEDERNRLSQARPKVTDLGELQAMDARLAALADEALVLANRRPAVARADAEAGLRRDQERRARAEELGAQLLADARPVFERIRQAHAELDELRERAIAAGAEEAWRDRAKRPRDAFGGFQGPCNVGLDLLDAFVVWTRTGESPFKVLVPRPPSPAAVASAAAEEERRQASIAGARISR